MHVREWARFLTMCSEDNPSATRPESAQKLLVVVVREGLL
jgi:hypothetical protein